MASAAAAAAAANDVLSTTSAMRYDETTHTWQPWPASSRDARV